MIFFDKMYKALNFKVKIELTSTKLIAWVILIVGFSVIGKIPEANRADYVSTILWVIGLLYGVKNVQEYFVKKEIPKPDLEGGGDV